MHGIHSPDFAPMEKMGAHLPDASQTTLVGALSPFEQPANAARSSTRADGGR